MTIQLVFLARLRERFGTSRETLPCATTDDAMTVESLLAQLRQRGGAFAEELAPNRAFRVAVNQDVVGPDHPVRAGDEVAIFPPVTGG
jgi:sulfur-carrier protein